MFAIFLKTFEMENTISSKGDNLKQKQRNATEAKLNVVNCCYIKCLKQYDDQNIKMIRIA